MTTLSTRVARLGPLRTVSGHVPTLVAVVARHAGTATAAISTITLFWAVTRNVASLAAVVAGWLIGALVAVTSNVAYTIATVATVLLIFLALTGEVTKTVALVALVPSTTVISATAAATTTTP